MSTEPNAIVAICMSAAIPHAVVNGSIKQPCDHCREPIWVSPSSQKMAADEGRTLCCLCISCAAREMQKEEAVKIHPFTPEQIKELHGPTEWK